MPLFSKTLLKTGIYQAPQGEFRADRKRLESLIEKFRQMKAAGIAVPVCWGHQPDATPGDPEERARNQYWLSKYNAGYLDDLSLTSDGRFDGKLDVPGVELDGGKIVHWVKLPDGRQVKGAVGEVSIAVKPWKDGAGKDWGEALVHVGITPHPVAHGTGGFSLGGAACTSPEQGFTLSLGNMLRTLAGEADVADDSEKKDDDKPKKKEDSGESGGGGSKDYFKEGLGILAGLGLSLPDDTTEANFWERVCVAGHALENAGAGDTPPPAPPMDDAASLDDETDLPPEPEPAEYTGEDDEEEAVTEEMPPVMMSLGSPKVQKDPALKALIADRQGRHRRTLIRRIERLEKRGVKPRLAAELRTAAEGYELSLDGEYQTVDKRLDQRIRDLELSLPEAHPLRGVRSAAEQPRPDLRDGDRKKEQEQAGDELASLAGAPARK